MQASGGMDWLIQIAEKLLRKHPDRITFLAPLTTFFLTVLVGTGHVVYTLMPIICDIALKKGIRPERPCGVASIASQVGITCSPIAAAVVAFVTISNANHFDITIPRVLMVSIPACVCGLMAAAAASYRRGLDLDKDPEFQKKIADPAQREYIYGSGATTLDKQIPQSAKNAVFIFLGACQGCRRRCYLRWCQGISRSTCQSKYCSQWLNREKYGRSEDESRDSDSDDLCCRTDDYLL